MMDIEKLIEEMLTLGLITCETSKDALLIELLIKYERKEKDKLIRIAKNAYDCGWLDCQTGSIQDSETCLSEMLYMEGDQ